VLIKLLVYTVLGAISPQLIRGVRVDSVGTAALVAILFGVVNVLLGWLIAFLLTIITLPLAILTFGLFWVIVPILGNMLLLLVVDSLLDDFELEGWTPAFLMGTLFAAGGYVASHLIA